MAAKTRKPADLARTTLATTAASAEEFRHDTLWVVAQTA